VRYVSVSFITLQLETTPQKTSLTNQSLPDAKKQNERRSDFVSDLGSAQCLCRYPYPTATDSIGEEDALEPMEDPELRHDSRQSRRQGMSRLTACSSVEPERGSALSTYLRLNLNGKGLCDIR